MEKKSGKKRGKWELLYIVVGMKLVTTMEIHMHVYSRIKNRPTVCFSYMTTGHMPEGTHVRTPQRYQSIPVCHGIIETSQGIKLA